MEVHHHPHSSGKKWTHYLWEFIMLFLAVFCGFLAENIRERISENEKAKELAESLYHETYADSAIIHKIIDSRLNNKERAVTEFIRYVKDSSLTNPSENFYTTAFSGFLKSYAFEPKDGILSQLRNSGALRFFKSSLLQEVIGDLTVAITNLRARNLTELEYIVTTSRPFLIKHFDFNWFEESAEFNETPTGAEQPLENNKKIEKPVILNPSQFSKSEAINIGAAYLAVIKSSRRYQYKEYENANHQLLEALRKEYHLL